MFHLPVVLPAEQISYNHAHLALPISGLRIPRMDLYGVTRGDLKMTLLNPKP